jgi:hypothetical protein
LRHRKAYELKHGNKETGEKDPQPVREVKKGGQARVQGLCVTKVKGASYFSLDTSFGS